MKKLILSIIFAGFALMSVEAATCKQQDSWSVPAQSCCLPKNWYIQANGSFGWHNDSKYSVAGLKASERQKPGFGGSLAIGRILDCWRLELEASHRHSSSKSKLYTSNSSLMVNGYYDIPVMDDLTFYVGAGAGISSVNGKKLSRNEIGELVRSNSVRHLDNVFAWQLMTGFSYALNEDWDFIAGYRLFATTKPTLDKFGGEKLKMTKMPLSNNVEIGLRFKF